MAETRRQLFKISILSTFGLASCARILGTGSDCGIPIFVWAKVGAPSGPFKPLLIKNENGSLNVYYVTSYPNYWPFNTSGDSVKVGDLVKNSDIYVRGGTRFRTKDDGSLEGDPPGVAAGAALLSWNEIGKK